MIFSQFLVPAFLASVLILAPITNGDEHEKQTQVREQSEQEKLIHDLQVIDSGVSKRNFQPDHSKNSLGGFFQGSLQQKQSWGNDNYDNNGNNNNGYYGNNNQHNQHNNNNGYSYGANNNVAGNSGFQGLTPCQVVSALALIRNRVTNPLRNYHHHHHWRIFRRRRYCYYQMQRVEDMLNVLMTSLSRNNNCAGMVSMSFVGAPNDGLSYRSSDPFGDEDGSPLEDGIEEVSQQQQQQLRPEGSFKRDAQQTEQIETKEPAVAQKRSSSQSKDEKQSVQDEQ